MASTRRRYLGTRRRTAAVVISPPRAADPVPPVARQARYPPESADLLALELLYEGANEEDLALIVDATDLAQAGALIADSSMPSGKSRCSSAPPGSAALSRSLSAIS